MSQCDLPKHMALELFRPFVIAELIKKIAYNIRGARHEAGGRENSEVWAILERLSKTKGFCSTARLLCTD